MIPEFHQWLEKVTADLRENEWVQENAFIIPKTKSLTQPPRPPEEEKFPHEHQSKSIPSFHPARTNQLIYPDVTTWACYPAVSAVIRGECAKIELYRAAITASSLDVAQPNLMGVFDWSTTFQGADFWGDIERGVLPKCYAQLTTPSPCRDTVIRVLGRSMAFVELATVWRNAKKKKLHIDLSKSLGTAFIWSNTPQGHFFWNQVDQW